jgi:cytochrome c biogenesis protein CcmG, thiol:disulfide interchange protein DsbE
MNRYLIPFIVFIALALLLGIGLTLNPREVPSPFVGKPAPQFSQVQLHNPQTSFSPTELHGKVWLLNVWASWCVSCRAEHEVITHLANNHPWPVVGLNYKDERADAIAWLRQFKDPYYLSVHDYEGDIGIDWGVYGVPETFIIDRKGIVRYKHIGPVTMESLRDTLLPLLQQLESEA